MVRPAILLFAAICAWLAGSPALAACEDLMPAPAREGGGSGRKALTAEALVRVRDIGYPDVLNSDRTPLALSPDGRNLAFVLSRADPAENSTCSALVVVSLDGAREPRVLDRGGALPRLAGVYRDLFVTTGAPQVITPAWSPDGQWIAYRKLVDGIVQVVGARADGGGVRQFTHAQVDVEDFAWSPDATRLVYLARPGRLDAERRIDEGGRTGWLHDASVLPNQSWRPQPRASALPRRAFAASLAGGGDSPASEEEGAWLRPGSTPGHAYALAVRGKDGSLAFTRPVTDNPEAESRIWARSAGGRERPCRHDACSGRLIQAWWARDGRSIVFLRRQGWNHEETAIYRWVPASGTVRRITRTLDAITGCVDAGGTLICARENAVTPRRVVAIDLANGRSSLVFDPNPELGGIAWGEVRRLRFGTDHGLPAWADLVLPAGYDGRSKIPLVVVQYHSLGFLRGGTGNDYPIFPLAAKGFAVLSFERPRTVSSLDPAVTNWTDALRVQFRDWSERRSIYSALANGIDAAIATGFVDPDRIGITGLSDGTSTTEFALVNSRRFAAAAVSTCCDDMLSSLVLGGFAWGDQNLQLGLPASVDNDRDYWAPVSLSVNARHIDTPILMQQADREALLALPAYGALREAGKAVELYIYPDEFHNKWQPAHRLATYERAIDWFAFWLQDKVDPAPQKREQYARWEQMRENRRPGRPARLSGQSDIMPRAQDSASTSARMRP